MLFICYPKCSTCKKAEDFMKKNKISYDYRDIKEKNPTEKEIKTPKSSVCLATKP